MAAANTTIGQNPKTIEVDTGSAITITKTGFNGGGWLINGGANKIYVSFPDQNGNTAAPVTNDTGNVENNVGVDRVQTGSQGIRMPKSKASFQAIAVVGNSVLYWIPDE